MKTQSIEAYDLPERVSSYDADMDLMHPNRAKMLEVVLEVLPFPANTAFTALDLGVGTGFFSQAILSTFPNCRVIAVDGAASMIEVAKARLGPLADRVEFRIGDFRLLKDLLSPAERGDLAYSAYALHHLTAPEKLEVISDAMAFLNPKGWFLNADLIVAGDASLEARIQRMRVEGIMRRAGGRDSRFSSAVATRAFLDDLEARDRDQPITLQEDLRILNEAGFVNGSVFWAEYREAVTGGFKG
jgi:tRNA (cmo5U34)-methyltransferase